MKGKLPKLLTLAGSAALVATITASQFTETSHLPPVSDEDYGDHIRDISVDALVESPILTGTVNQGETILIPRTFVRDLPEGLTTEQNAERKKSAFENVLLPLILRANERIILERTHIKHLQDKMKRIENIGARDRNWLESLCKRYRVTMPEGKPTDALFEKLLTRVDIIPPSLALGQAAIESGWGTSYFAQEGNALFGEWVWDKNAPGIVPKRRAEGKTHRIRAFKYLFDSVDSYMLNLNRNRAYSELRARRLELRKQNKPVQGSALAPTLLRYSERGQDYVDDLLGLMRFNEYYRFDAARLENV